MNKLLNVTSSDVGTGWDKEAKLVCERMFKIFNNLSELDKRKADKEIDDIDLRNDLHNEGKSILSEIEIQAINEIEKELGYDNMNGLNHTSFVFEI
ncbi:MAG TPA: hypothetical protein VN698_12565 [Bacteroidia bacterium]|nr:hypothetical protein [Bacteroidia bacterium]